MEPKTTQDVPQKDFLDSRVERRSFLKYAGAGAAALALTAAGCKKDRGYPSDGGMTGGVTLDFKSDIGVLNYAYALEQLEAAFYIQAATNSATFTDTTEKNYFLDVQYHEIAHREFFKKALAGNAIGSLEVDFSAIDFKSRDSVLAAAKTFEDLGVAAYNGAGRYLTDPKYLVVAGQIVSVEARHAAWVRDRISPGTFADLGTLTAFGADNSKGLDGALKPDAVIAAASKYIKTKITVTGF